MKKIKLPRKLKKRLIAECGRSEYETQVCLIRIGLLSRFDLGNDNNIPLDFTVPKSGLICTVCGYDDSLKCFIDDPEEDGTVILCGEHAAEEGYCCCCGQFSSGMTSFDFTHPGYCDNCYDQVVADTGEDDGDDDEYSFADIGLWPV